MRTGLGPVLRMVGLLIEVGCLIPLLTLRSRPRTPAGARWEYALYAGLLVGFVVWAVGLVLGGWSRPRGRGRRDR